VGSFLDISVCPLAHRAVGASEHAGTALARPPRIEPVRATSFEHTGSIAAMSSAIVRTQRFSIVSAAFPNAIDRPR